MLELLRQAVNLCGEVNQHDTTGIGSDRYGNVLTHMPPQGRTCPAVSRAVGSQAQWWRTASPKGTLPIHRD